MDVKVRRTGELSEPALRAIRALLDEAFAGDFSEDDWSHTLGGTHVLAFDRGMLFAHGAVVPRTLWIAGSAYDTGYVEGVAVRPNRRQHGLGTLVMREIERVLDDEYALGALSATDEAIPFYEALGWRRWKGPTCVLEASRREDEADRVVRTPDDDTSVFVRWSRRTGDSRLAESGDPIVCDWRRGDVW